MKIFILSALLISNAYAIEFTSSSGVIEYCVASSESGKSFGIKYSKDDLKEEKVLCSLDFYNDTPFFERKDEFHHLATCPKVVKSSPALEIFAVDTDLSREVFLEQECSKKKKRGKKLAKYKVSTSCSYTPSILAYYHFSRLLDIGNVPVSIYRELDINHHIEKSELGAKTTEGIPGWLHKNWNTLLVSLQKRYASVTHSLKNKSYGALVENPTGENVYTAMFGKGVSDYYKHSLAKQARKSGGIERQFTKDFKNLPKLFALKDYTDMLIIDGILSQFDRYGNADYWKYYYYVEAGKLKRKKYKSDRPEVDSQMRQKGAIILKRLLLKDNDCGINFRNRTLDDKALAKVSHFSQASYDRLNKLNTLFSQEKFKLWLKSELKFKQKDIDKVQANTQNVLKIIKDGLESGNTLLDLNPEDFINI